MTTAELARSWFEDVWNQRSADAIERLLAPRASSHHDAFDVSGSEQFRTRVFEPFTRAIPDLRIEVESVIGNGEEAAVRWHATGTHRAELLGIPATGKPVSIHGMSWFVIRDGQLVEGWDAWSLERLMQSLAS